MNLPSVNALSSAKRVVKKESLRNVNVRVVIVKTPNNAIKFRKYRQGISPAYIFYFRLQQPPKTIPSFSKTAL